jgi:hypothetical protein
MLTEFFIRQIIGILWQRSESLNAEIIRLPHSAHWIIFPQTIAPGFMWRAGTESQRQRHTRWRFMTNTNPKDGGNTIVPKPPLESLLPFLLAPSFIFAGG